MVGEAFRFKPTNACWLVGGMIMMYLCWQLFFLPGQLSTVYKSSNLGFQYCFLNRVSVKLTIFSIEHRTGKSSNLRTFWV